MISYSGIDYNADFSDGQYPTLRDVAIGLSRINRWTGATKHPWSVLQHSLVVSELLKTWGHDYSLAGLLHDIEESMGWSDISQTLKPPGVHAAQAKQRRLYASYLLGQFVAYKIARLWDGPTLHEADKAAAASERLVMLDGKRGDGGHLCAEANSLNIHFGYGSDWSMAEQVGIFLDTFERLKSAVYAMWDPTPGTLQQPVAATTVAGADKPPSDSGCDAYPPNQRPWSIHGGYLGGVAGPATRVANVKHGISACSVCGAWFNTGQPHACHPEAAGPWHV